MNLFFVKCYLVGLVVFVVCERMLKLDEELKKKDQS